MAGFHGVVGKVRLKSKVDRRVAELHARVGCHRHAKAGDLVTTWVSCMNNCIQKTWRGISSVTTIMSCRFDHIVQYVSFSLSTIWRCACSRLCRRLTPAESSCPLNSADSLVKKMSHWQPLSKAGGTLSITDDLLSGLRITSKLSISFAADPSYLRHVKVPVGA